jgi:hypothetical protein
MRTKKGSLEGSQFRPPVWHPTPSAFPAACCKTPLSRADTFPCDFCGLYLARTLATSQDEPLNPARQTSNLNWCH